ncbi:hypothetical protein BT63DRAFT_454057 [Microthyrium microscopicum]|uniref:DUF3835 domain-containing protein n=1 Tax=Microthyrium microscopicum TaxID=703497 RepID=A0A6A6UE30_9PEZI|nr:hypothetical protein BT63DRAFT_454057 [Microthyrium microscopicum]
MADIDSKIESLENAISQLRRTMSYWLSWQGLYMGLEEGLAELPSDASPSQINQVFYDHEESSTLEKAGIDSLIIGANKSTQRTKAQILNIIKDRVQTGQRNSDTIQKQIDKNHLALDHLLESTTSAKPEDAVLLEVTEQLDESGSIVSSKVENFQGAVDDMTNLLQAKSVLEKTNKKETPEKSLNKNAIPSSATKSPSSNRKLTQPQKAPAIRISNQTSGRVLELDDEEGLSDSEYTVINTSTPAGEVEARRELHNQLQQIGPVVATMDLEEDEGDWSEDDYESSSEEENEYGMVNIRSQLDEDYVKEMEALIKKHKMSNAGREVPSEPVLEKKSALSKGKLKFDDTSENPNKKGVRFAESLDISSAPEELIRNLPTKPVANPPPAGAPLAIEIVERPLTQPSVSEPKPSTGRLSRFKASKMAKPKASLPPEERVAISTSQNKNDLETIVQSQQTEPPTIDEFALYRERMLSLDPSLDRSIFQASMDDEDQAAMVSDKPQKISKFKAARLGLSDDEDDN